MGMDVKEKRSVVYDFSDKMANFLKSSTELTQEERILSISIMLDAEMTMKKTNVIVNEIQEKNSDEIQSIISVRGRDRVETLIEFMQTSDDWLNEIKDIIKMKKLKNEYSDEEIPEEIFAITQNYSKLSKDHQARIILSIINSQLKERGTDTWMAEACDNGDKMLITQDRWLIESLHQFFKMTGQKGFERQN